MKVHFGFSSWHIPDRTVATVGNFDGVHVGHQAILARVAITAAEHGSPGVAITFDPVPKKILQPDTAPPLIQTLEQRLHSLEQCRLDHTIVVEFNEEFARNTPEQFVTEYLVHRLSIRGVIVGQNFSFGHEKRGNLDLLRKMGTEHDFTAEGIPEVKIRNQRVSSTLIRQRIQQGEMEEVAEFMGRPFALQGIVVPGEKLGGSIGVPTANLKVENEILPATGVYVSRALLANGDQVRAVSNVGYRPTVGGKNLTVEAHLLQYSGSLYGQKMQLQFLRKLRDEMRFSSVEELKDRIHSDIHQAEAYFK